MDPSVRRTHSSDLSLTFLLSSKKAVSISCFEISPSWPVCPEVDDLNYIQRRGKRFDPNNPPFVQAKRRWTDVQWQTGRRIATWQSTCPPSIAPTTRMYQPTSEKEETRETHLGNVVHGNEVLVGVLVGLVDDQLGGGAVVLSWHLGWWGGVWVGWCSSCGSSSCRKTYQEVVG